MSLSSGKKERGTPPPGGVRDRNALVVFSSFRLGGGVRGFAKKSEGDRDVQKKEQNGKQEEQNERADGIRGSVFLSGTSTPEGEVPIVDVGTMGVEELRATVLKLSTQLHAVSSELATSNEKLEKCREVFGEVDAHVTEREQRIIDLHEEKQLALTRAAEQREKALQLEETLDLKVSAFEAQHAKLGELEEQLLTSRREFDAVVAEFESKKRQQLVQCEELAHTKDELALALQRVEELQHSELEQVNVKLKLAAQLDEQFRLLTTLKEKVVLRSVTQRLERELTHTKEELALALQRVEELQHSEVEQANKLAAQLDEQFRLLTTFKEKMVLYDA